jgi:hypothetical protein
MQLSLIAKLFWLTMKVSHAFGKKLERESHDIFRQQLLTGQLGSDIYVDSTILPKGFSVFGFYHCFILFKSLETVF